MTASRRRALAGLLAAGMGAMVLLTANGGTLAGWSDSLALAGGEIRSGQLGLVDPRTSLVLERPGQQARDVTASLAGERLVVGDTLRVTSSVTVRAAGDNLGATLTLDTTGLESGSSALQVQLDTTAPGLTPVPGAAHSWHVRAADDGTRATGVVVLTVPASRDGLPAGSVPDTSWWGTELQGAVLRAGSLSWHLTQDGATP